jgi:uroporphyrinogen-III synthase
MSGPLRVLSFESRKATEMRSLIERHGGVPTIAPAMREVPLGMTPEIQTFVDRLSEGSLDLMILLTGVGAEALATAVETEHSRDWFLEQLQRVRIVVRGPKPFATLKKWGVRVDAKAPEPNTWYEVVQTVVSLVADSAIDGKSISSEDAPLPLSGLKIAVQEYGQPSTELYAELHKRGASVLPVPVYRWQLPEDISPVVAAIDGASRNEFDVTLFTTAQHIVHTVQIAESLGRRDVWLASLRRTVIASIGPTATERLEEYGLPVDIEPEHAHMGHLVRAAIDGARECLDVARRR